MHQHTSSCLVHKPAWSGGWLHQAKPTGWLPPKSYLSHIWGLGDLGGSAGIWLYLGVLYLEVPDSHRHMHAETHDTTAIFEK